MNIVKALIVFLLLCVVYSSIIRLVEIKDYQPLNQFQGNRIAKEELFFADSKDKTHYMIGSSLMYRMQEEDFPTYFRNVAMGGSSSAYGLRLLAGKGVEPEILLIETNILIRSSTLSASPVDKYLYSGPMDALKTYVPITRQKYQPVSYAINLAYQMASSAASTSEAVVSEKARAMMFAKQQESYSETIEENDFTLEVIDHLRKIVDGYQANGTCVVFLEMPISCELSSMPKAETMRSLVAKHFPSSSYNHLNSIDCSTVETTDGIHLTPSSAKILADYILQELEDIQCDI